MGLVVLDEGDGVADRGFELGLVVGLEEVAAIVGEDSGFQEDGVFKTVGGKKHWFDTSQI